MNRVEKEEYLIRLYKKNRSTREIAKLMHMSFRDIVAIIESKENVSESRIRQIWCHYRITKTISILAKPGRLSRNITR
jgi:hypothetical protein